MQAPTVLSCKSHSGDAGGSAASSSSHPCITSPAMTQSQELLVRLATALAVSAVLTPLLGRLAVRWSFVDAPGEHRRHHRPTPLLGGAALWAAVTAAVVVLPTSADRGHLWAVLGAATLVAGAGLVDDRWRLPVAERLLVQLVAAAALVSGGLFVILALPGWLDALLTVLWIVGITNAFNLLDNMDGLATGVTAVAALGFLVLTADQGGLAPVLAVALLGAALGFLLYNFHPAKIFMGDAGSLFLGLLLAVLGLELQTGRGLSEPWIAALVPVLLLAVPIFDTTLVTVSRWRRGHNPLTTPGNDHLSHRLRRIGLSTRGVALAIYAASAVAAVLAGVVARGGPRVATAAAVAALVIGLWALFVLDGPPGAPHESSSS